MRVLVTGAGGFLGRALVRALRARGDAVSTLQRGEYPLLEQLGATVYSGDIADRDAVIGAGEHCDAVIHAAAKAGVWGDYADYHRSNVSGTLNVIEACRRLGIKRLVYTSSPSIVFAGGDEQGIDESTPFPAHYLTHYQRTKAEAEQSVLAANSAELATVALRPHLLFGPGDPHLVPRVIARAKKGTLRLLGNSRNLVDVTYIDNAVSAHLLALDALHPDAPCAGKAYFISNGEPMAMADILNSILAAAGMAPVTKSVSPGLAYAVGAILEKTYALLHIQSEPPMTRFIARQLACSHWYDITAARRDLQYAPTVSVEEGMQRLQEALEGNDDLA